MLTPKESKMAALLLKTASDRFSNHGCNDLGDEFIRRVGLTDEEKIQFVQEVSVWSGDRDRYKGGIEAEDFDFMQDWLLMSFLAHKLEKS